MRQKLLRFTITFIGITVVLLGLLWFLQGIGIIQMCLILCFVDYECVRDESLLWETVGAIILIIGMIFVYIRLVRGQATLIV
jgi:hypothetical protein